MRQAGKVPGPKNAGIAVSVPPADDFYVTSDELDEGSST
jgi:hypothetical protein